METTLQSKHLRHTVKHGGGSVMVWGCMAASVVGNLVFIDGKMDKPMHLNILRLNLKESVEKIGLPSNYIFQQDNDPKHTAYIVREWLLYNTPKQLHAPPQSPNLNPIEHLWGYLKRRLANHNISGKNSLKMALREEWSKIPRASLLSSYYRCQTE